MQWKRKEVSQFEESRGTLKASKVIDCKHISVQTMFETPSYGVLPDRRNYISFTGMDDLEDRNI